MCNKAECAKHKTTLASRSTMQTLYTVQTTSCHNALAANARYIRYRLVLGITKRL
jgi:hypothetical protein